METMMARRKAFTLIELMVVIVVIILLAGLLIPVIGIIRASAQNARSQQQITNLSKAIETYYQMFNAYPGPLSFIEIHQPAAGLQAALPGTNPLVPETGTLNRAKITMSENLALGLLGGLRFDPSRGPGQQYRFDASLMGKGPKSLSTTAPPKGQVSAFLDVKPGDLSAGKYADSEGAADDSEIPEFLDGFPNGMPVLYLRARVGAAPPWPWNSAVNPIVTNDLGTNPRSGQYDISQIIGYTGSSIGVGKAEDLKRKYKPNTGVLAFPAHGLRTVTGPPTPATLTSQYPFDAYPYFKHPSIVETPRQKDGYILIGAGKDRIYGTEDDITNFGSVAP
jgi:prepilin-type N-terminal cleavage/methylation domain-containing protein